LFATVSTWSHGWTRLITMFARNEWCSVFLSDLTPTVFSAAQPEMEVQRDAHHAK
jgi:hypothetical protein